MKKIPTTIVLVIVFLLSACATRRPVPQNVAHASEIAAIKKIEIFYHHQDYAVIVRQAGGLLALASIGEADRIEQRSKAFAAAIEKSYPGQDINLQFAEALAVKIRARGVEVKITNISRPLGDTDIGKTRQYIDAPKTAGYAPLVLRGTTRYIAPSFAQGFRASVDVTYLLASPDNQHTLISTYAESGAGETYASFDALLAAHPAAHQQLSTDLQSLVPRVYADIFQ